METAYQPSTRESRPELVLPVRRLSYEGLPTIEADYPSTAEKAYWILREKIITLEFPPGSVIRDTDLTEKLEIGRTPIREALKRLEVEMFVVSLHRKGTYVKEINLADIRRHYQVRRQLLALAVALATQAGESILNQLERKSQYLVANAGQVSLETTFQSVADLELDIAKASGNPFLCITLRQYCGYARRTWHMLKSVLIMDDLLLDDYPRIMAEVGGNEGDRSSQLMAKHVDQVHLKTTDRFLEKFI